MSYNDLRDLVLAGVRWELCDWPGQTNSVAPAASVVTSATGAVRTPVGVVPPIAPVQSMSVQTAAAMAARPGDMAALNRMIAEFNHPLRVGATNVVLPHVAPQPNGLVVLTDIPGADDDATGRILSGAAGDLMDKMLAAIGMSRENVSIVPLIFWRTPGGRVPTDEELDLTRPFVDRALELMGTRIVLTLGTHAAALFAGVKLPAGHGVAISRDGRAVVPIFHPNYLLLKPTAKRDAWTALQNVQKLLKNVEF